MARVTIHLGSGERLEARISKATPLGALLTEALVYLGAVCFRGPALALRALADALTEAADLADDYDADPDAFTRREQADRDPDRRPLTLRRPGRHSPGPPQPHRRNRRMLRTPSDPSEQADRTEPLLAAVRVALVAALVLAIAPLVPQATALSLQDGTT